MVVAGMVVTQVLLFPVTTHKKIPVWGGNTTSPIPGQKVAIYNPFGQIVATGVLMRATESNPPRDNAQPRDVISTFDVKIEQVTGELPN